MQSFLKIETFLVLIPFCEKVALFIYFSQVYSNVTTKLKEGILQIYYYSLGIIYRLVFVPQS
jgi:ABC-type polysaccharide/polyol phosphate export permease